MSFKLLNYRPTIFKTAKAIYSVNSNIERCPKCSNKLENHTTYIPRRDAHFLEVCGKYCTSCKCLFSNLTIEESDFLKNYLANNIVAKEFSLNGVFYHKSKNKAKKRATKETNSELTIYKSCILKVLIINSKNESDKYIIVSDKEDERIQDNVLHYSNEFARHILSAVNIQSKNKMFSFRKTKYTVTNCIYRDDFAYGVPKNICPKEIRLKSGGGFHSYIKNSFSEIVDMLFFSPYTDCYEIVHATYDSNECYYYIDPGKFRKFVNDYGNPGIRIGIYSKGSYYFEWENLHAESMLMLYGYTVSQQDNLSQKERQSILTELVDLNILKISYIVNMLEFFIRSHSADKYSIARSKWKSDSDFIANYKVNPKRFLIFKAEK